MRWMRCEMAYEDGVEGEPHEIFHCKELHDVSAERAVAGLGSLDTHCDDLNNGNNAREKTGALICASASYPPFLSLWERLTENESDDLINQCVGGLESSSI